MQNVELSIKAMTNPPDRRLSGGTSWLQRAEWAALIASAVGSFVAGIYANALYAAAPLTLTLALNLANRQRFEQQIGTSLQDNWSAIASVDRLLRSEMEAVRHSVQELPPSEHVRDIEASMLRLSTLWGQLQQRLANVSTPFEDPQIQQEFAVLRRAIVRLRDSTDASIATIRQSLDGEISLLRQNLIKTTETGEYSDTQTARSEGGALDLAPIQSQIAQMHQRLAELEQKNREVVKPYLARLMRDIKLQQSQTDRIEASLDKLSGALAELLGQIDSLAQQADFPLDPQQISTLHATVERLSQNLPTHSRFAIAESPPPPPTDS